MSDLAATAERLRIVKDACTDFITLWTLDCMMAESRLSDRIFSDVVNSPQLAENGGLSSLYPSRWLDD